MGCEGSEEEVEATELCEGAGYIAGGVEVGFLFHLHRGLASFAFFVMMAGLIVSVVLPGGVMIAGKCVERGGGGGVGYY